MDESSMTRKLDSAAAVINALGGNRGVASLIPGKAANPEKAAKAVSNWRQRGIPARYADVLRAELDRKGYTAPSEVLGMAQIAETEAAE
jgi:hypothetical protein